MDFVLFGIVTYVLVQLLVGILVSRRTASETDYLLAGRRLGLGLGTFTIFATWFGAESCVSTAGMVYAFGLAGGRADPLGYSLCIVLLGLFYAVPFWQRRYITLCDLYRERYSISVERLATLLMIPGSILWAGAQIRAFGQVLSAATTFDVELAISFAALVVVLYTMAGGLLADVVTDFLQSIALIAGLLFLLWGILQAHGGFGELWQQVDSERLSLIPEGGESLIVTVERWVVPIIGAVLSQELVGRVLASRSPQAAYGICFLGAWLYFLVGLIPVFLGLVGFYLLPGLEEPEQIVPLLAKEYLPPLFFVFFAGALISAILSTVDSALLAAASLFSHNLIVPLLPEISERGKVWLARLGVFLSGGIAYWMALSVERIYDLVEMAAAMSGGALFVVGNFALFSRFGGKIAALTTLVVGMAVWSLGEFFYEWPAPYLTGLSTSLVTYLIVGWGESVMDGGSPKRRQGEKLWQRQNGHA